MGFISPSLIFKISLSVKTDNDIFRMKEVRQSALIDQLYCLAGFSVAPHSSQYRIQCVQVQLGDTD